MNEILIIRDLYKTYNNGPQQVNVIKGINLQVKTGEIVVIIGPSGVGKSTLMHLKGFGGLEKAQWHVESSTATSYEKCNDKKTKNYRPYYHPYYLWNSCRLLG